LYELFIEISIINAYKLSSHSDVSKELNTLFIASSERSGYRSDSGLSKAVSEAKKNVNWACN